MNFVIHFICSEYGFKHNLRQIKIFVYFSSAHCLIVLNMNWKHDSRIVMKCLGALNATYR